jgi:hypothetical protein
MAKTVIPAFIWANGITLVALAVLVVLDEINLAEHLVSSADRIINHQVVMALLGATTVQIGTIAAIIARYLFQHRPTPAAQKSSPAGGPRTRRRRRTAPANAA